MLLLRISNHVVNAFKFSLNDAHYGGTPAVTIRSYNKNPELHT